MASYFSHDYHARHDPKMQKLLMKHGIAGIGLFWAIVEFCYERNGKIKESECECIAFDMRTQCDLVTSVLNDFDLFVKKDDYWYSESINRRIELRNGKSEKAAKSAQIRWKNANAMRTQCDGNAIKEIKLKEIKENTIPQAKAGEVPQPKNTEKVKKVIEYLNEVCGTSYRHNGQNTYKHVNARIEEGFHFVDFVAVIDHKNDEWGSNEEYQRFLRPETLFGTKFESYLQAAKLAENKAAQPKKMWHGGA